MSALRKTWMARLGAVAPFIAAALIALPASARASSAYSAGGLGEPSLEEPARLRALGGAGAAEHGPRAFSLVNPASAAEVDHLILEGTVMPSMRRVSALSFPGETARETVVPSLRALVRVPGRFTLGGAYLVGTNGRFGIDRPESSGAPSTLRIDGAGGIDLIRITLARRVSPSVNLGVDYEVIVGSFRGTQADIDRNPGGAKFGMPLPGHFRVGVFDRRHHARDAGCNHCIDARRRFAEMRTGLQRHIERRAPRGFTGPLQRLGLGMRPSAGLRPATADDHAILDDDRTDGRVRPGAPQPAPAECERKLHEALIRRFGFLDFLPVLVFQDAEDHLRNVATRAASSAESSPSTASKSLASRKLR